MEALYDMSFRYLLDKVGGMRIIGLELVLLNNNKKVNLFRKSKWIKNHLKNANNLNKEVEFQVGDHIAVKIYLSKGIMRFGKKGKLSSHFIFPLRSWKWFERFIVVSLCFRPY